jgi:hypothetical protein
LRLDKNQPSAAIKSRRGHPPGCGYHITSLKGTNIMDDPRLAQEKTAQPQTDTLVGKLEAIIRRLPPDGVTLAKIRDLVGEDGLMILTGLLSLVFLIPVSIPGVSTVFGAAILMIGVCRLIGRNLWLPQSFENRVVASDKLRVTLNRALVWLHRLERVSRPGRLSWLTSRGPMNVMNNCALILGAVLLMAPFGLIPFSNTFPALAILCLAVGLLQRDGACILLGYLANIGTIVYFTALIAGGGMAIREALQHFAG